MSLRDLVRARCLVAILPLMVGCKQQTEVKADAVTSAAAATSDKKDDFAVLPGVDTTALTPREKGEWSKYVREFASPCAGTGSIAQCVMDKKDCTRCTQAAKFLVKSVANGLPKEEVEKKFRARYDAAAVKNVPIDGSPTKGSSAAPVTLVEFADFECPFCGRMAPVIAKAASDFPDKLQVVYKFIALPGHPHGEIAARAAFSAGLRGKFWEMNHRLFSNQQKLEQSDLDGYAKELGIGLDVFRKGMNSKEATARLEADKKLADALDVHGTPSIFINGREFDLQRDLGDWIKDELAAIEKGEKTPAPAGSTAPAGSAMPAGSAVTKPSTAPATK